MIPTLGESNSPIAVPSLKMSPLETVGGKTTLTSPASKMKKETAFEKSKKLKPSPCPLPTKMKAQPQEEQQQQQQQLLQQQRIRGASFDSKDSSTNHSVGMKSALKNNVSFETIDSTEKRISKTVSFNKRVRIRKIRQLEDMPEREFQASYYTDVELSRIRNNLRAKIRMLVEDNFQEEFYDESIDCTDEDLSSFCIRGLEHEFPQGKFKRKQLKMMSRGAVLEEQRLQRQFYVTGERSSSCHTTLSDSTSSTLSSSLSGFSTMSGSSQFEDPAVAIAEIYRIESKPAVKLALEVAKRDEYVADQIYFAHQAI